MMLASCHQKTRCPDERLLQTESRISLATRTGDHTVKCKCTHIMISCSIMVLSYSIYNMYICMIHICIYIYMYKLARQYNKR